MKRDITKKELMLLKPEELVAKIDVLRRELFSLRINSATAHSQDYSQFKKLRKDIARALTYLGQKQMLAQRNVQ